MFSKLFGKDKKAARPSLNHPKDLRAGDLFELGLCPISEISGKTFTILEANTLDYGDGLEIAFVISADRQKYGLSVISDDEGERLSFSKLIGHSEIDQLFGLDSFASLFDDDMGGGLAIQTISAALSDWAIEGDYFRTVDALKGYFEKGDHRLNLNSKRAAEFDYYQLVGANSDYSIEVEVYDGDETEVYICRNLPMHTIDKLWPQDASG